MSKPEKSVLLKTVIDDLQTIYDTAQKYPEVKKAAEDLDASNEADFDKIYKPLQEYVESVEKCVAVARKSLATVSSNKLDNSLSDFGDNTVIDDSLCIENGEVSVNNSEIANTQNGDDSVIVTTRKTVNVENSETVDDEISKNINTKTGKTVDVVNSETVNDELSKNINTETPETVNVENSENINTKNGKTVDVENSETVNNIIDETLTSKTINVENSDTIKETTEGEVVKDGEAKVGFLKLVNIEKLLAPKRVLNTVNNTCSDTIVLSDSDNESQDTVCVTKKPVSKGARKDFSQTKLSKLGVQKHNLAINPFSKQNKLETNTSEDIVQKIKANNSLSLTKNNYRNNKANSLSVLKKNTDQSIKAVKTLSPPVFVKSTDKSIKLSSSSSSIDTNSSQRSLPHKYDAKYYQKTYVPLTRVPAEQLLEDYKINISKKMEKESILKRSQRYKGCDLCFFVIYKHFFMFKD